MIFSNFSISGSTSGSDLTVVPVSVGRGGSARGGREGHGGHGGHVALWGRYVRDIVPMHREERDDLSMQPYLSMQPVPSGLPCQVFSVAGIPSLQGVAVLQAVLDVIDSEGGIEDLEVVVNYLDNSY